MALAGTYNAHDFTIPAGVTLTGPVSVGNALVGIDATGAAAFGLALSANARVAYVSIKAPLPAMPPPRPAAIAVRGSNATVTRVRVSDSQDGINVVDVDGTVIDNAARSRSPQAVSSTTATADSDLFGGAFAELEAQLLVTDLSSRRLRTAVGASRRGITCGTAAAEFARARVC